MRIGIDIDNVISNFDEVLLKDYLEHDKVINGSGIVNKNAYVRKMFDWSEDYEKEYYKNNIERLAYTFEPLNDCVKYMKKLREEGNSIYIISGRNNGEYSNPHEMTVNWLKKYKIPYDKLILTNAYNHIEKANICIQENIDLMIDDSSTVCKVCKENNINTLLFSTDYNKNATSCSRVNNWKDIYVYVANQNKVKLSSAAKTLIFNHSIGKIINIFLDVFLTSYFYKISDQNIFYLCIYNIIGWITATVGALILKNYIKTKNKVALYRFGAVVKAIYIFLIILLGKEIINYVWLIGIIYGVSVATSGFPLNMIESENIAIRERAKYLGYSEAIKEIVNLLAPIFLGAYITLKSYQTTAIIILIFSIIKILITFKIENRSSSLDKTDLKKFYNIYKTDKTLKKLYLIEFFKGINVYGIMSLVVSLLIIYKSSNDFELGKWSSLFSLTTILSMYILGKHYTPQKKSKILIFTLAITSLSFIAILYKIDLVTILFYDFVYYIFMNMLLKITEIDLFDYSNKEPFKTYNTEYFVFREVYLNVSRIIGYSLLLLLVGVNQNLYSLKPIFGVIVLSTFITILLSLSVNTKNNQ